MSNWKADKKTAFVCVDPQVDFCEGGNLAVPGGSSIMPLINELQTHFDVNVKTQDFHPAGHKSFATSHEGKNVFELVDMPYGPQVLWPDHCVQGTEGADSHPALNVRNGDLIIQKGMNRDIDSYSALLENDKVTPTRFPQGDTFVQRMNAIGVNRLVFSGLAFDYCVGYSALDAAAAGFEVIVVDDACRSIAPETDKAMREKMAAAGVKIVSSADLPVVLGATPPGKKFSQTQPCP